MTVVTLNRKIVESYIGKQVDTTTLKHAITYLGTDLEDVTDNEIIVEIFPNRPDLLSNEGMGRALAAFIGTKQGLRSYKAKNEQHLIHLKPIDKGLHDCAAGAVVKGLELDDERIKTIMQVQEKLHLSFGRGRDRIDIGIYPLEKIRFPLTYSARSMKDTQFKPLKAERDMNGLEIIENHPMGKEYGHLIHHKEKAGYWSDADNNILSMVPLINSHDTGKVTENTTDIFIDCTGYDWISVHQIMNMLCTLFADMGGTVYRCTVKGEEDYAFPSFATRALPVDVSSVNNLLGTNITEEQLPRFLAKMGMHYENGVATIPCYRTDMLHLYDVIEDIAIAYGYDNIQGTLPDLVTVAKEHPLIAFQRTLASVLVGYGFLETRSYHLISKQHDELFGIQQPITILHSVSSGYEVTRGQLKAGLLEILSRNAHHEYPHQIFELGHVFARDNTQSTGVSEPLHLAGAISNEKVDYTQLRKIIDGIARSLGLLFNYKTKDFPHYLDGRSADIYVNDHLVGELGEIHPQTLTDFSITTPTVAFELDVQTLYDLSKKR